MFAAAVCGGHPSGNGVLRLPDCEMLWLGGLAQGQPASKEAIHHSPASAVKPTFLTKRRARSLPQARVTTEAEIALPNKTPESRPFPFPLPHPYHVILAKKHPIPLVRALLP
ncbi:hypothetical protein CC78DRAFT_333744 [Lojkania enalia]|uniref:Uncharacterized protein n=1 Tax=Lojkania enalia TaxID=147567 RepID=A0A9P4N9A4_9PLEO|nr:hypothetical protein CC78DRAFT_333744 [Didymosphaeria enalia]